MIRAIFGNEKYTTEELNARLKFFIGLILGFTLFGIVFVVLYSLIFVNQIADVIEVTLHIAQRKFNVLLTLGQLSGFRVCGCFAHSLHQAK